jgi:hypothetical protein
LGKKGCLIWPPRTSVCSLRRRANFSDSPEIDGVPQDTALLLRLSAILLSSVGRTGNAIDGSLEKQSRRATVRNP